MQTFDQALVNLCASGHVTPADAVAAAGNPHDFKLQLAGAGLSGPSAEQREPSLVS